jgi:hypothetical protein
VAFQTIAYNFPTFYVLLPPPERVEIFLYSQEDAEDPAYPLATTLHDSIHAFEFGKVGLLGDLPVA